MEQTYVMVKPDGVQRGLIGEIVTRIEKKRLKNSCWKINANRPRTSRKNITRNILENLFSRI